MTQDIGNSVALALRESLLSTANFLPNLVIAAIIFIVGVVVASIFRSDSRSACATLLPIS